MIERGQPAWAQRTSRASPGQHETPRRPHHPRAAALPDPHVTRSGAQNTGVCCAGVIWLGTLERRGGVSYLAYLVMERYPLCPEPPPEPGFEALPTPSACSLDPPPTPSADIATQVVKAASTGSTRSSLCNVLADCLCIKHKGMKLILIDERRARLGLDQPWSLALGVVAGASLD